MTEQLLKKFGISSESVIVYMKTGSDLFGLSTANSDLDLKCIVSDLVLTNAEGNKTEKLVFQSKADASLRNGAEDIDLEIMTLSCYLRELEKKTLPALEMLHASDTLMTSEAWEYLVQRKESFYTNDAAPVVAYARGQIDRYGVKGSKIAEIWKLQELLNSVHERTSLRSFWAELPQGKHLFFEEELKRNQRVYNVCGKYLLESTRVKQAKMVVERIENLLGPRAKEAALNNGIDWKAVSHAFRALYQSRQLYTENSFSYPLKESTFLRQMKAGIFDFDEEIQQQLTELLDDVERLSKASPYPEDVVLLFLYDGLANHLPYSAGELQQAVETPVKKKRKASKLRS